MSYEVINSLRAKSTVRIVGNTAITITLSSLAKDEREVVTAAAIAQASGVTDGVWRIYRGDNTSGELILELPSFSHYQFYEFDSSLANTETANVHVTNSGTCGTMILQLAKTATYTTDMGKI
jgi:hypothetical protein